MSQRSAFDPSPKRINLKNQISSDWPAYMISDHACLRYPHRNFVSAKKQDINRKIGTSEDFPMRAGKYQTVFKDSRSIFVNDPEEESPAKSLNLADLTPGKSAQKGQRVEAAKEMAGLGASNQAHGFLFHNGDKKKGKIFANLLNHGIKQPPELRKKLEFYLNKKSIENQLVQLTDNLEFEQEALTCQQLRQSTKGSPMSMHGTFKTSESKGLFMHSQPIHCDHQGLTLQTQEMLTDTGLLKNLNHNTQTNARVSRLAGLQQSHPHTAKHSSVYSHMRRRKPQTLKEHEAEIEKYSMSPSQIYSMMSEKSQIGRLLSAHNSLRKRTAVKKHHLKQSFVEKKRSMVNPPVIEQGSAEMVEASFSPPRDLTSQDQLAKQSELLLRNQPITEAPNEDVELGQARKASQASLSQSQNVKTFQQPVADPVFVVSDIDEAQQQIPSSKQSPRRHARTKTAQSKNQPKTEKESQNFSGSQTAFSGSEMKLYDKTVSNTKKTMVTPSQYSAAGKRSQMVQGTPSTRIANSRFQGQMNFSPVASQSIFSKKPQTAGKGRYRGYNQESQKNLKPNNFHNEVMGQIDNISRIKESLVSQGQLDFDVQQLAQINYDQQISDNRQKNSLNFSIEKSASQMRQINQRRLQSAKPGSSLMQGLQGRQRMMWLSKKSKQNQATEREPLENFDPFHNRRFSAYNRGNDRYALNEPHVFEENDVRGFHTQHEWTHKSNADLVQHKTPSLAENSRQKMQNFMHPQNRHTTVAEQGPSASVSTQNLIVSSAKPSNPITNRETNNGGELEDLMSTQEINNLKTEKLDTETKALATDKSNFQTASRLPQSRFQDEKTVSEDDQSSTRGVSLKKLKEKGQPTRTRPMAPRKAKSSTIGGLKRNLQGQ